MSRSDAIMAKSRRKQACVSVASSVSNPHSGPRFSPFQERERAWLEDLYRRFHKREFLRSDPIEFAGGQEPLPDREIIALVTALLSYGQVRSIRTAVRNATGRLGPQPRDWLLNASKASVRRRFAGFGYRFTSAEDLAALLWGMRGVIGEYGSIELCFSEHLTGRDTTVVEAIAAFVDCVESHAQKELLHLLPHPKRGSACKRVNLFLRWMVRHDCLDPGGWRAIDPSQLIVPLDTHVHRVALDRGWTKRAQANLQTALEVTAFLRKIFPQDPLRYDFSITRTGIIGAG